MLDEEDFESYVLSNTHSDYIISVSDFRDAYSFIKEEMLRLEKNKIPTTVLGKPDRKLALEIAKGMKN